MLALAEAKGMLARVARDRYSAVVSVSQSLCLASLSISKLHKVVTKELRVCLFFIKTGSLKLKESLPITEDCSRTVFQRYIKMKQIT